METNEKTGLETMRNATRNTDTQKREIRYTEIEEHRTKEEMERTFSRLVTFWGHTAGSSGRLRWGDLPRTLLQLECA